ncbi:MAG: peptidase, partial [Gemmatimonadales bacterium]
PRIPRELVERLGLPDPAAGSRPAGATALAPVRIGLWDQFGGSMPSGWLRWMFEQYEFPFELVYAPALDQGNLSQRFDVLVFVGGAIPAPARGNEVSRRQGAGQDVPDDLPAEYRAQIGRVSAERTIPALKGFLEAGGRIVTIGSSTALAEHLGLPIANHLVERHPDGSITELPSDKYYVPGSLLEVAVDPTATSAAGMPERAIVMFDESPVFELPLNSRSLGIRPVAWFDSATPLRSGWAWGQTYLEGGVAAAEATVGRGTLYLFGPEITFRSQPHGTFRLLFNSIWGK